VIKTEIKPEPLNGKRIGIASGSSRFVDFDESSGFWFGDVKSACEFYLRYKDRPDLFEKEQKNLIDYDCRYDWDHTFVILKGNRAIKYKEWLFKLAFKDVLEKGDNQ